MRSISVRRTKRERGLGVSLLGRKRCRSRSNTVSVLLGNGDGSFQAARNFFASRNPDFVAVGDFNGDSLPDLAVASGSSNTVSVLINNTPIEKQKAR